VRKSVVLQPGDCWIF